MELLKLAEHSATDDTLTLSATGKTTAYIEIENPWSGDTETGIGREACFTLTKQQALLLADALMKWSKD